MADENYTVTGQNFFSRWSSKFSYMPFGLFTWPLTAVFGVIGTAIDSLGWLAQGKIGSALTAAAAGAVSTAVNTGDTIIDGAVPWRWWVNAASGVATGESLGNHARALTESVVGSVGGALGFRPQVLASNYAGIGSINMAQPGPGQFATAEAARRGMDPNAMYANYRSGNAQDYQALENARRAQVTGPYVA